MRLSEIDFLHPFVLLDRVGRALRQDAALVHAGDTIDKAEREIHVVFDQNEREITWQCTNDVANHGAFGRRQSRCRLVEQQQPRISNQRQRQLKLSLLTVGQLRDWYRGATS